MLRRPTTGSTGILAGGPVAAVVLAASVIVAVCIGPALICAPVALVVLLIGAGPRWRRGRPWTPADAITATRLGLIIVCTALFITAGPGLSWTAVFIGSVALALDACDGFVARRTQVTPTGAAFDETVDALFVLIFSLTLIPLWGVWTVLPGLYYYAFKAAAAVREKWRQGLPFSYMRKVVAAAQGILLVAAGSPLAVANPWLGWACVELALAALTWSFARDIVWLERHVSADSPQGAAGGHVR